MKSKATGNNFLATILTGVAVGAVLGMLFAPDKGSVLRKKLSGSAKKITDDIADLTQFSSDHEGKRPSLRSEIKSTVDHLPEM
ncbi:MAG: YtxH-like protein [Bacteroidota bacterium]|jgi:gas vesicle protein